VTTEVMVSLYWQLGCELLLSPFVHIYPFPIGFGKSRDGNPKETNYVTYIIGGVYCIHLKNSVAIDFIKRHTWNKAENSIHSGIE